MLSDLNQPLGESLLSARLRYLSDYYVRIPVCLGGPSSLVVSSRSSLVLYIGGGTPLPRFFFRAYDPSLGSLPPPTRRRRQEARGGII